MRGIWHIPAVKCAQQSRRKKISTEKETRDWNWRSCKKSKVEIKEEGQRKTICIQNGKCWKFQKWSPSPLFIRLGDTKIEAKSRQWHQNRSDRSIYTVLGRRVMMTCLAMTSSYVSHTDRSPADNATSSTLVDSIQSSRPNFLWTVANKIRSSRTSKITTSTSGGTNCIGQNLDWT